MDRILLSTRAARGQRRPGPGTELNRLQAGWERLSRGEPNLDIKPVTGSAPWLRVRIGDWRILCRSAGDQILVARIIPRRELQQAVRTLE